MVDLIAQHQDVLKLTQHSLTVTPGAHQLHMQTDRQDRQNHEPSHTLPHAVMHAFVSVLTTLCKNAKDWLSAGAYRQGGNMHVLQHHSKA